MVGFAKAGFWIQSEETEGKSRAATSSSFNKGDSDFQVAASGGNRAQPSGKERPRSQQMIGQASEPGTPNGRPLAAWDGDPDLFEPRGALYRVNIDSWVDTRTKTTPRRRKIYSGDAPPRTRGICTCIPYGVFEAGYQRDSIGKNLLELVDGLLYYVMHARRSGQFSRCMRLVVGSGSNHNRQRPFIAFLASPLHSCWGRVGPQQRISMPKFRRGALVGNANNPIRSCRVGAWSDWSHTESGYLISFSAIPPSDRGSAPEEVCARCQ
jgi:hypothetical protein